MDIEQLPGYGQYRHLTCIVKETYVPLFFPLLQQGVNIRRRVGCSIEDFLRREIGATPETIDKIQSIMLDGKPVDDIVSSLLHNGSTLALSAAMPGLVGATLRRGGAYSSFRSGITYHEAEKAGAPGEGWVRVKIFNLLMAVLGPDLLRAGVLIRSTDLLDLLKERTGEFGNGCSATLDRKPVDIAMLWGSGGLQGSDHVFCTVAGGQAAV